MAKFIEIQGADGSKGYLNPEHVMAVLPGSLKAGPVLVGTCTAALAGGLMVPVKEGATALVDRLAGKVLLAALLLAASLAATACALSGPAARTIGQRTGENVTVTLTEGEGVPSCTVPPSDEVTCTFPEGFVLNLTTAAGRQLEAYGAACVLAMGRVPHAPSQEVTCAWHLAEILAREAKATRYRSGREE